MFWSTVYILCLSSMAVPQIKKKQSRWIPKSLNVVFDHIYITVIKYQTQVLFYELFVNLSFSADGLMDWLFTGYFCFQTHSLVLWLLPILFFLKSFLMASSSIDFTILFTESPLLFDLWFITAQSLLFSCLDISVQCWHKVKHQNFCFFSPSLISL